MSDSKSPQVSRTLLSILTDLNNAVVWMVSTCPFISKSSSLFINLLVTVPRAPIIIGISVTFMFQFFFSSLASWRYLYPSFHFLLILLCGQLGQQSPQFYKFSFFFFFFFFFLLVIIRSGHLAEIRGYVSMSKSQEFVCVSFSKTDARFCIHHLFE